MRIGLIGHNSIEYIEKLFEIWNSGNSAVLIDYDTPPSVIQQIIDEYKIQFCYLEDQLCHLFDNSPTKIRGFISSFVLLFFPFIILG